MIEYQRLDARLTRALEPAGVVLIRDDDRNRRVEPPLADRVDQRLQVAAAPRDQYAEPAVK